MLVWVVSVGVIWDKCLFWFGPCCQQRRCDNIFDGGVVFSNQSCNEVARLSMPGHYDMNYEMLLEVILIGIDFVVQLSSTALWGTALIGGILVGLIVEAIFEQRALIT